MRTKLILLLLPLTLLAACSPKQSPGTAPAPLEPRRGQVWQLVSEQGRPLPRSKHSPTLLLNPDSQTASGLAYCNEYTFRYTLQHPVQQPDGDRYKVQFTFWGCGSVECPEGGMNAERRYIGLLDKATSLRLTATTLTLYQKNNELLHFELQ